LVHAQQMREQVFNKSQLHHDKMKRIFDRHTKEDDFKVNDLVLKWDARNDATPPSLLRATRPPGQGSSTPSRIGSLRP
jgi:hypothetical protein